LSLIIEIDFYTFVLFIPLETFQSNPMDEKKHRPQRPATRPISGAKQGVASEKPKKYNMETIRVHFDHGNLRHFFHKILQL
jgi:hypothetical protein